MPAPACPAVVRRDLLPRVDSRRAAARDTAWWVSPVLRVACVSCVVCVVYMYISSIAIVVCLASLI